MHRLPLIGRPTRASVERPQVRFRMRPSWDLAENVIEISSRAALFRLCDARVAELVRRCAVTCTQPISEPRHA